MPTEPSCLLSFAPAALLRVTGSDAASFLQGQFTNELRQGVGAATYGLWLSQKGRVLADSHVLQLSESEFLVVSIHSPAVLILRRLEDYIIADDVAVQDETAGARGLVVWGPESSRWVSDWAGVTPASGRYVDRDGLWVFQGRGFPAGNWTVVGPRRSVDELGAKLGAQAGPEPSQEEIEFARIKAGIPVIPRDIGPDDLPNEGGLEDAAISYTKGCYLGQEVMARLKHLGQVRRRLQVVCGRGAVPAARAPLYQSGKKIGEIRSAAGGNGGFVALAMLSLVNLDPRAGLGLAPEGPADITVQPHG